MSEFLYVVDETEELPLRIDLGATAQREAIEAFVVAKIAEYRFHRAEASSVTGAAIGRIDALSHALSVSG